MRILMKKVGIGRYIEPLVGVGQAKLFATDAHQSALYGWSVAISDDGSTAIVGARQNGEGGAYAGAGYIYNQSGTSWALQEKIVGTPGSYLGTSVTISGNGNVAVMGTRTGNYVYISTRSGGVWTQPQQITPNVPISSGYFGKSVSISSDGNHVVVGANGEDTNAGAGYIFTRTNGIWTQQQRIVASDRKSGDQFGHASSISGDGNTIIIGSWYDDVVYNSTGSAYIFTRINGVWTQQAKLLSIDIEGGDLFGVSVSISEDGNIAIVGANFEDTGGLTAGSAYIFSRSEGGWTQQQKIQSTDIAEGDQFGHSVSITNAGNMVIVGAVAEDGGGVGSGAAYIFEYDGSVWSQRQKILAIDNKASARFGFSADISGDGSAAIVGASFDSSGITQAGAAYIFV